MRIVSYNINGLRPRVAQSRSLSLFLDSLNADIICLQETKVSRQELTADIAIAEGYESFFSCNRDVKRGRGGYSGVATFCRVGQTSSTTSPVLPLAADEGFTGLLHFSRLEEFDHVKGRVGCYEEVFKTELSSQELLRLDNEGRCLVTDHGSFVLFNIYAPSVDSGDKERLEFKVHFFRTLQRRWEGLLNEGRRVIALGDFNVSPFAIDHCDPGPDFDKHVCRKWLRSILHAEGGPFRDVFRFIHPGRKETYTCWSQSSGAEEFNYGTRIDLIIAAGPCVHEASGTQQVDGRSHSFVECEVQDSDILSEFRRVKPGTLSRWHGGRTLKLEGSDHAPVYVQLKEQRHVELHDVPHLAARYMPELRGRQQNLVSLLKRQLPNGICSSEETSFLQSTRVVSSSRPDHGKNKRAKGKLGNPTSANKQDAGSTQRQKQSNLRAFFLSSSKTSLSLEVNRATDKAMESISYKEILLEEKNTVVVSTEETARLPLARSENQADSAKNAQVNCVSEGEGSLERSMLGAVLDVGSVGALDGLDCTEVAQTVSGRSSQTELYNTAASQEKSDAAFEWKRIQSAMARAVPLCHGHKEPCVARVVKKPGPNKGRGFYVCARPECCFPLKSLHGADWGERYIFRHFHGPSSNPEAGCEHFEWSSSFKGGKGKVLGN